MPCFYKLRHLIEHLAECFHVEVIDGVQYSLSWSWVKMNTLNIYLGVNSPFRTSPTALLIVFTIEHFNSRIYNEAIWDQERAHNLSRVRYGTSTPVLVPWELDINYTTIKMGNKPSFPLDSLLGCLLVHWEGYQLEGLKKGKKYIKYCAQYWPTYTLGGGGEWPQSESLGFNTIFQLCLYCK